MERLGIQPGKHAPKASLYIVLVAILVRVLNVLFLADSPLFAVPTSDESEHFTLASSVATGSWLAPQEGVLMRPALFAWVCAALFKLLGKSYLVVHAFVFLCDVASVYLWHKVAVKSFGHNTGVIAGIICALYFPFIHFSATGYMEPFALALGGLLSLTLIL